MGAIRLGESTIRDAIFEYLQRKGHAVWRDKQLNRVHPKGSVYFRESKGVSDILGCTKPNGRIFCIEVKKPGEVASPEQEEFMAMINKAGGLAFVATCVDHARENGL